MASNYTFTGSVSASINEASGFNLTNSGNFTINITGVNEVRSGRIEASTSADTTKLCDTVDYGKLLYVKNMDDTNYVDIYDGVIAEADLVAKLEPGEWCFVPIRGTDDVYAQANTLAVSVEFFVIEIDSNA